MVLINSVYCVLQIANITESEKEDSEFSVIFNSL